MFILRTLMRAQAHPFGRVPHPCLIGIEIAVGIEIGFCIRWRPPFWVFDFAAVPVLIGLSQKFNLRMSNGARLRNSPASSEVPFPDGLAGKPAPTGGPGEFPWKRLLPRRIRQDEPDTKPPATAVIRKLGTRSREILRLPRGKGLRSLPSNSIIRAYE